MRDLASAALPRIGWAALPERVVVVDVERQRLGLIEGGELVLELPVSTAANGIGGEAGSNRTPPGWHRIRAKIGADAPAGTVFRARVPTGERWTGGRWTGEGSGQDLILTRILTLEGLEDGVNRGPGVDSLARFVYLHGTNHEDRLGTPASHGCVRLSSAGITELFDRVQEGDPVVVVT